MNKTAVITGAAGALGSELARSLRDKVPALDLALVDRQESAEAILRVQTATGTERGMLCDLFGDGDVCPVIAENDVILWNAAINVDNPAMLPDDRSRLREAQNRALDRLLVPLSTVGGEARRKLLVLVNSVVWNYGQNPDMDFLKGLADSHNLHYGRMKQEQADKVFAAQATLQAVGTQTLILHPGSINSPFTDTAVALRNAKKLGGKMGEFDGRGWKQEALLEPKEIADPVAVVVEQWLAGKDLPGGMKQWVMINKNDLAVGDDFFTAPSAFTRRAS